MEGFESSWRRDARERGGRNAKAGLRLYIAKEWIPPPFFLASDPQHTYEVTKPRNENNPHRTHTLVDVITSSRPTYILWARFWLVPRGLAETGAGKTQQHCYSLTFSGSLSLYSAFSLLKLALAHEPIPSPARGGLPQSSRLRFSSFSTTVIIPWLILIMSWLARYRHSSFFSVSEEGAFGSPALNGHRQLQGEGIQTV